MDAAASQPQLSGNKPTQPVDSLLRDSMVTVRLSEPPALQDVAALNTGRAAEGVEISTTSMAKYEPIDGRSQPAPSYPETPSRPTDIMEKTTDGPTPEQARARRGSNSSDNSEEHQVDWEQLEKTEELEPRDQDSEDSTALLLARLEQENNLLVTNPKSGLAHVVGTEPTLQRNQSRPPSMQQLKKMVSRPTPPALRYSLLPTPPMTDLEFYAALVQDYKRTAQRLPTLLSKKIRSGIPPPLRGVVWQSMSGARDSLLEDEFDRLCGESSSFEGIIAKDLGRSFPGVEMFRDPEGDGQLMLGRVLKCFSLYDHKIGYCQGLGFLVGPLLMHMGDKQAFCVLVRLMENYDLRSCFLPDLSGLHVRIYQFRELLRKHLPSLNSHLEALQIEPGYVSQWFLSFFAVTCPLPMLFRIYDVIFAEGASETIMRVALAVMRKNEEKILACGEFEDVMQLLLSRGLWDCYHYNADEFVEDFVSLTSVVTHESLRALEASYKESGNLEPGISPSVDSIGSAATRFLGRLWAGTSSSTKSSTLSPGLAAPARPASFLRRSPSKQSIASTLNSTEGGTDSILSSNSTEATSLSRDSSNTDASSLRQSTAFSINVLPGQKASMNNQNNLHSQIEDLLMALSELQRDHAILATQLQREREEREEDHNAVRSLLDGLKKKSSSETVNSSGSERSLATVKPLRVDELNTDDGGTSDNPSLEEEAEEIYETREDYLTRLLEAVEERVSTKDRRRSSMLQSKSQLREELARSKEQLLNEVSKSQDLNRRLSDAEHEISSLREQLREGHSHARSAHAEKQRLEKLVQELRARKSTAGSPDSPVSGESEWPSRTSTYGGLRELKLGRTNSSRAPSFAKRTSSLSTQTAASGKENDTPEPEPSTSVADNDALILELVQAKTAEATAKQEAEEAKAKLESLKRLLSSGMAGGDSPTHRASPSQATIDRSAVTGPSGSNAMRASEIKATTPPSAGGGGFWAGWGKRSVSTGPGSGHDKA